MLNDDNELDPVWSHSQEPAEGDEEPGEVSASAPHAEEPSEGSDDIDEA